MLNGIKSDNFSASPPVDWLRLRWHGARWYGTRTQLLLCLLYLCTICILGLVGPGESSALAQGSGQGSSGRKEYSNEVKQFLREGSILLKARKFEEAQRELSEAIRIEPDCPEAYTNLGVCQLRMGNHEKAEQMFRKALECDPLFMESLSNLALVLYQKGRAHYDEAALYYGQALRLSKNQDYELHANLAHVLRDKGDYGGASDHYKQALQLKPDFAPAYNGLAVLFYKIRRYDLAVEQVQKAIKYKPDYALAYYHLGMIETARNNIPAAIDAYEMSLKYEVRPEDAEDTRQKLAALRQHESGAGGARPASMSIAAELIQKHKWEDAYKELQAYSSRGGEATAAYWNNLGFVVSHRGDYDSAIDYYKKALALRKGRFAEANYNLGQVLRLKGDTSGAEKAFRAAIADAVAKKRPYPLAHNALGMTLKKKGDLDGAEAHYKRAIAQSGNDLPVVHYNLALLLEKTDRSREAVREYQLYLSQAPHGLNARQVESRLRSLGVDVH